MVDAFRTGRYKALSDLANVGNAAKIADFYSKTGVAVNASENKAAFRRDAISAEVKMFNDRFGKISGAKATNENFFTVGDFIIATGQFEGTSEKAGTVKGNFIRIWKKEGGDYFVYHNEFAFA